MNDLDRKVRRGRERLAQDVEPPPPPSLSAEKAEQLSVLEEKVKNLLEQVEALGEEGKVDEAEALMRKVLFVYHCLSSKEALNKMSFQVFAILEYDDSLDSSLFAVLPYVTLYYDKKSSSLSAYLLATLVGGSA